MKCVVKTHLECERVEARRWSFAKPLGDAGGEITGADGEMGRRPTGDVDGLFQVQMGQSERFHSSADLHFSKSQLCSARCWLSGVYLQSKAPLVLIFRLSPHHH